MVMDCFLHVIGILVILPGFLGLEILQSQPQIRCALAQLSPNVLYRLNNEGDRVHYRCRRGYWTLGDVFAICEQGQWSARPPVCIARGCKPVYYISHGRVVLGYGGAMVKFSCDEGYSLKGDQVMICDGKNWNTTIPKCRDGNGDERREKLAYSHNEQKAKNHTSWLLESDYSCIKRKSSIRPPTIKHAIANTQWAIMAGKPRLFTIYRCYWGYLSQTKAMYLYCQNGEWVGALPKCEATVTTTLGPLMHRDQPDPAKMIHADWLNTADYSCMGSVGTPGQILPQSIPDGHYVLRHGVIDGTPRLYAELICNDGYRHHDGLRYVYCSNKSWIGPKMMCVRDEKDDSPVCGVNNGGCDHFCEGNIDGISCSCREGYHLGENKRICIDVDECQTDNGGCDHVCQNTVGSYNCHCYVGHQLSEDGQSCKPDAEYKGDDMIPPMALFSG